MAKLRVLVADDSETVRKRIVESLAADPGIEVVGEAEDGQRVIELCLRTSPDVITMDMMMPIMTGVAATEYIMAHQPTPILIVSSSFNRGELFKIYDALAAGAVDVLEKPTGEEAEGDWEGRLIAAVKLVSRIKVITHPRARLGLERSRRLEGAVPDRGRAAVGQLEVAAIGASTGGPGAIVEVLRKLPPSFQVPILIVLHMNEPFGAAFIDWLDAQINRPVSAAQDGARVESAKGRVLVAPCGKHLVIRDRTAFLTLGPERHSCRPSVDTLFESIAPEYGPAAAACLLTGMGKDGALGLLRIREAGGITIAQDEASSVVYGMPREAVLLGAALQILPIGEIGPRLAALQTARMEALA
ncbi:MAG: chemotaxis-specific protein-glutamate methyltransferase CheB [Alphaproteobacteria bacterium]